MISIVQKLPEKMPGEVSLFISFSYNQAVIDIIKSLQAYNYNPKTKTWEISVCDLANFLDKVALIDDIKLTLPEDPQVNLPFEGELQSYKTTPFDYQQEGIKYGLSHDRWLLLDAPGLGKSLQIIYLAQELKERKGIKHCLVICGVNTLKTNWKKEIEKHSNLSCRILGERVNKKGNLVIGSVEERLQQLKSPIEEFFVITNVETIRNEDIVKQINNNKHNQFDMIVVDELHVCKSSQSTQGKHLLKLTNAKYRVGLTGTILTNSPTDCYVPLKWIGAEHANFSTFKYFYCIYGGKFNHDLLGYKNMKSLKQQLSDYSLRRTKDILKLPPKTVINEYVEMNPEQQKLYTNIKNGIVEQVDKVELDSQQVLSMVTRLRQVTACPKFLTSEDISSAKVDRAIDLTNQITDSCQKVVIFTTYKEAANMLHEALPNSVLCTGDVPDWKISQNINQFQTDPECNIFIGTWQKCGTGITLTAASYMIFIDTPWTSASYTQAQDRIYRVGTTNKVTIYNLICCNTIDERVFEIVSDKEMLEDFVVDDKISVKMYDRLKSIIKDLT